MWLIYFFIFIFVLCIAILIPFFCFIAFTTIYSIPYLIWAALEIRKPQASKNFNHEAGPLKNFFRATQFYFQLVRLKKPTLM